MDKYIGKILDNRYEVLEIIGVGGMAVVYKALDKVLDRYVAIKILKDEYAHDEEFRKRFANESHAVAQLSHNNIVSVYDVSRSENPQYIVMELIEGITLKEYLTKKGSLSWQETLFFTQQIAKALEHAHSRGIIHQDIKPHNICLLRDGTVKVTDFGIARFEKNQETRVIQEAIGSVHYISPEQAKGSAIDHRADLYSLGVMMYEMLTGRVPFDGDTPLAIVMQHINAVPLPPSEVVPGIPKGMDDIVMRAMCPTLNKRYANANEIYNDLERLKRQPSIRFETTSARQAVVDGETIVMPKFSQDVRREQEKAANHSAEHAQRQHARPIRIEDDDEDEDEFEPAPPRKRSFFGRLLESPVAMGILGVLLCVVIAGVAAIKLLGLGGSLVVVPKFIGANIAEVMGNEEYASQFVFEEAPDKVVDNEKEPGTIVDQSPAAGENVKEGSKITLTVTTLEDNPPEDTEKYELEDLTNQTIGYADIILSNREINYTLQQEASLDVEKDHIIETIPAAGAMLSPGDEIILVVSTGVEGLKVPVPNLIGRSLSDAQKLIREAKLTCSVEGRNSDAPANEVIDQSIDADTMVDANTEITITFSLGSSTVPDEPDGEDTPIPIPGISGGEEIGTATIDFDLPTDVEIAHVVITLDGQEQVFERTYDTTIDDSGSYTCSATVGVHTVRIQINGVPEDRAVRFE